LRIPKHYSFIYLIAYPALQIIYSSLTNHKGRGHGAMSKLKIVEIVIMAGSALLSAVRYVIKFIDYIIKLRHNKAEASAA